MERAEYERMAVLEESMWWYRALHSRISDWLRSTELQASAGVLDAGCGTGGLLRRLSRETPGLEYFGLDNDAQAVEIARTKSSASVSVGSVNSMPFADCRFGAIISADVLCHAAVDERRAMGEFFRCLAPTASLMLSLPAYEWMKSSHDAHVHNVRRYTASRLRRIAEEAGFEIAGIGYWNSLLLPVLAAYRLTIGRRRSTSDVHSFPAWQDRVLYTATAAEAWLCQRGARLPFGASVWLWGVRP
jgi:SAM-dependent methyltransferase